jgi:hypothetical protein
MNSMLSRRCPFFSGRFLLLEPRLNLVASRTHALHSSCILFVVVHAYESPSNDTFSGTYVRDECTEDGDETPASIKPVSLASGFAGCNCPPGNFHLVVDDQHGHHLSFSSLALPFVRCTLAFLLLTRFPAAGRTLSLESTHTHTHTGSAVAQPGLAFLWIIIYGPLPR